jgi:cell division protein FtsB
MEQKIKTLLGEYAFLIAALQDQNERLIKENEILQDEIAELKSEDKSKRSKSN